MTTPLSPAPLSPEVEALLIELRSECDCDIGSPCASCYLADRLRAAIVADRAAYAEAAVAAFKTDCTRITPATPVSEMGVSPDFVAGFMRGRNAMMQHIAALPADRSHLDRMLAERDVAKKERDLWLQKFNDLRASIEPLILDATRRGQREGVEWAVAHPRFAGDCHQESDEAYRARGLAALFPEEKP